MDRRLASIILYLVLTSALAVVVLTQEPVGWRAFYITVELQQAVSEAQFIIPKDFAILWNKFEHFQFTEPHVIIVQEGVQRQSVVWYHDNTLYIAVYGLSTSTRRIYIYIVEKQLLSSTALQLSQTYWNMQPIAFVPTVNYLLLGFGEISYTHLRDVLAMPPHGFITITESTYDNIRVLKIVPLFTVDGRTYVANVYTTPHETVPLTARVVLHVNFGDGGDEPIPIGRDEEPAGYGSAFDFIVELTLAPPHYTDFSNTTLCIVEDVYNSKLYYYTIEEDVQRRVKRIWVSLPSWVAQRGFVYLTITRCNEDWDELGRISGIFLSPGEYSVEYYLRYPRIITVHSFRYYDPYMSGGGLLPGNFTVWCTSGEVVQLNFTGHRDYFVPCDPVRYRLTFVREAPLSASLYLEPGDIIAPHLFDFAFDGVDDYLVVGLQPDGSGTPFVVYGWSEITIAERIYPVWPKISTTWAHFSKIGDPWTDYPSVRMITDTRSDYTYLRVMWTVRTPDGAQKNYFYDAAAYRNSWVHVVRRFTSAREYSVWVNGARAYNATVPSTEVTVLEWNPATASRPWRYQRFVLGASVEFAERMTLYQSYLIIHSRALTSEEIQQMYSGGVVSANALEVFIDATFTNGTRYFNLGRNPATIGAYNGVSRVPAEHRWIWHVKNLADDGYLHIKFVPRGWFIEFRRVSDGALLLLIDTSQYPANPAGLVEDIVVSIQQPGWYVVNFRPSYPFGAPSPPYAPPELPPPGDGDGGEGDGGGGQQFDCSICDTCWNWSDPSLDIPDFCYDCYAFCEPPGWTPPAQDEASQPPQQPRKAQVEVVRGISPRETQQYSLLLIAALFTGVAGVAFFVVGPAAIGLVPHIVYILVLAELVPMWVGALLIASMVILSLYVFLSKRSGGGAGEGG
ncbi:MAG: hypothetical protein QW512_03065 [Thermofilaceae archaeon]